MFTTLQLSAVRVKYIHTMKLQGSSIYVESEELQTYGMHQEKLLDAQASWDKKTQAQKNESSSNIIWLNQGISRGANVYVYIVAPRTLRSWLPVSIR